MRLFDPEIWSAVTGGAIAKKIRPHLRVTPLIPSPVLSRRTGADVWLKLENLQRTGSFKLRGALARLAALDLATPPGMARPRVIAASAGNHGLGVALAARLFDLSATVMVPAQTPRIKLAGMAALGADVHVAGASYDHAEREARQRAAADPTLVFVSPFDDDHVIAGNGGLLGRELVAQLPDVAAVIAPVGGGGLASGLGIELVPRGISVFGASAEVNCAMKLSLDRGSALTTFEGPRSLADGLEGGVSERTFAMARDYFPRIGLSSESAIAAAVVFAFRSLGISCEPSSAVALATLLDGQFPIRGRRVVVVITGANIDSECLDQLLAAPSTPS